MWLFDLRNQNYDFTDQINQIKALNQFNQSTYYIIFCIIIYNFTN